MVVEMQIGVFNISATISEQSGRQAHPFFCAYIYLYLRITGP